MPLYVALSVAVVPDAETTFEATGADTELISTTPFWTTAITDVRDFVRIEGYGGVARQFRGFYGNLYRTVPVAGFHGKGHPLGRAGDGPVAVGFDGERLGASGRFEHHFLFGGGKSHLRHEEIGILDLASCQSR